MKKIQNLFESLEIRILKLFELCFLMLVIFSIMDTNLFNSLLLFFSYISGTQHYVICRRP